MALAVGIGGGGLILFGVFLVSGSPVRSTSVLSPPIAIGIDVALSLLFFVQHSGMVRSSFRRGLARWLPDDFHLAVYAIASGLVLVAVVLCWQPTEPVLVHAEGTWRVILRAVTLLALAAFVWAVRALRHFDTFGLDPIKARLRGDVVRPPRFVVRGPYRWVRHPLYFLMMVLIWSCPDVSLDRLVFDGLWTLWIVVGAHFEERDLVAAFGARYRDYQRAVPMLVPWRLPHHVLALSGLLVVLAGGNPSESATAIPADEIAPGDAAWARRSEELDATGRPLRAQVEAAISAYTSAAARDPTDIGVRLKLMEALYFLAHFVSTDTAEQKRVYDRSLELTREVMRLLGERTRVNDLAAQSIERQIELLRDVPEAAHAHFWAGITWGLWGLSHGNLAAGRAGVASRIRDHARILIGLDETHADGGGPRLLGRLYTVAPRVPFVSWWIDRQKGIEWLRRAHTISKRDPRNALFLAEALLAHEPRRHAEALDLLREAADHPPDPTHVLEDMETITAARERLAAEEHARE